VLVAGREEELLGIFTDGDLRRTIQTRVGNIMSLRIGDIMTRDPRRCAADDKAVEAMQVNENAWGIACRHGGV
jgi:arabinose-5-phosphate isomerase